MRNESRTSINPETDVKEVVPYLEEVDMILVMCVHPGFGGQKFIPESLDKIRAIRAMLNEKIWRRIFRQMAASM
mgnify:FL=1